MQSNKLQFGGLFLNEQNYFSDLNFGRGQKPPGDFLPNFSLKLSLYSASQNIHNTFIKCPKCTTKSYDKAKKQTL